MNTISIILLAGAIGCIAYLVIQLYISRRVIRTLQETAIIVTPPAKKKGKLGSCLLQALLFTGAVLAALNLVFK
jgi:hypothetical protein